VNDTNVKAKNDRKPSEIEVKINKAKKRILVEELIEKNRIHRTSQQ
jgi:hypothetical protein